MKLHDQTGWIPDSSPWAAVMASSSYPSRVLASDTCALPAITKTASYEPTYFSRALLSPAPLLRTVRRMLTTSFPIPSPGHDRLATAIFHHPVNGHKCPVTRARSEELPYE